MALRTFVETVRQLEWRQVPQALHLTSKVKVIHEPQPATAEQTQQHHSEKRWKETLSLILNKLFVVEIHRPGPGLVTFKCCTSKMNAAK